MTADLLQFRPRANPKADRAFWIGPSPIEIMAAEILKDEAFKACEDIDHIAETVIAGALADNFIVPGVFDTAPAEYCAPDGDCA